MGKKKYCAIYIQTKRYCLFGSCFTDIFFEFLSLLIPEWRQFKWFKLNWHVINQGWFLSLFKGFVKYMYDRPDVRYLNQIVFLLQDSASILLGIVSLILAFRFSVNIFTVCFYILSIYVHVDLVVCKWCSFTCTGFIFSFCCLL